MRLRLHIETDEKGSILLQSEEMQYRIICINKYDGKTGVYKHVYKRLPFPYINFAIRYLKNKNKFVFPGYGLFVAFSEEPLKSVKDNVFNSPTDITVNGYVCTDHKYDYISFDTLKDLTSFVINHWWELPHYVNYLEMWEKLTLEDMKNFRGSYSRLSLFPASSMIGNGATVKKLKNRKW